MLILGAKAHMIIEAIEKVYIISRIDLNYFENDVPSTNFLRYIAKNKSTDESSQEK